MIIIITIKSTKPSRKRKVDLIALKLNHNLPIGVLFLNKLVKILKSEISFLFHLLGNLLYGFVFYFVYIFINPSAFSESKIVCRFCESIKSGLFDIRVTTA